MCKAPIIWLLGELLLLLSPAGHLPANYKNTGSLYHLARPRFSANSAAILAKFMFLYLYAYAKYASNKLNLLLSNHIMGAHYLLKKINVVTTCDFYKVQISTNYVIILCSNSLSFSLLLQEWLPFCLW
jgi:hypothetical protein